MSNVVQWASSGTKLLMPLVSIGLLLALVLYKLFFKDMGGLFHSIGFSVSSKGELGQDKSSRYKLLFALIIPPAAAYGASICSRSGCLPFFSEQFAGKSSHLK